MEDMAENESERLEEMSTPETEEVIPAEIAAEGSEGVEETVEFEASAEEGETSEVDEHEDPPVSAEESIAMDEAQQGKDEESMEVAEDLDESEASVEMEAIELESVEDELADSAAESLEPASTADAEMMVEVSEQEADEEPDDDRYWFVVHCYSGYENKVRHNLEQRIETMGMKSKIFDVVVPTEEEIEIKDGKRRTVERRVFPGYILVQMIMDEDSWYVVRNTPGVTGFVGMGNEPTPLRPEEVSQIVKRMEAEAPRIKVTYKTGQKVRIIDGPFNDFIGTVDDIDMERAKVRVMVSFFGRETPVELDFLQVEKA